MEIKNSHILFASSVLTNGGAERVVSILASGMAESGIKTSVLVNRRCEKEYLVSDKVNVYSLPSKYAFSGNVFHKMKKALARYRIMKEINPDIVLGFLDGVIEPTFLCCCILRKKFIPAIRVNPSVGSKTRRLIRDIIIWFSDACFVQNEEQKAYFSKRIQKKTFVVANPVASEFMEESKTYAPVPKIIISAGRLSKQKNQKMLIYGMKKLNKIYPELLLKIYGAGPEKDNLEELIAHLNLEQNVQLCGRSENMRSVYKFADIFVLSSDFEGMPNALMEAMAMGLPCISTDCPTGPRDLIHHKENGLLIPVGNVDMLVKSLDELCKNAALRQRLGENAHMEIQNKYKTDVIIKELCDKINRYVG